MLKKPIEIACCTLSIDTIHMKYICIIFFSQLYHENKSLDEAIKVLQTALSKHPDHANNQGKLFVFLFITVTDLRTYYRYPSLQFTMHCKYSQLFFHLFIFLLWWCTKCITVKNVGFLILIMNCMS